MSMVSEGEEREQHSLPLKAQRSKKRGGKWRKTHKNRTGGTLQIISTRRELTLAVPASTIPVAVTSTAPLGAPERVPSPRQGRIQRPEEWLQEAQAAAGGLGAPSRADTLRRISEEIWQLGEGAGDPGDVGAEIEAKPGGAVRRGAPLAASARNGARSKAKPRSPGSVWPR